MSAPAIEAPIESQSLRTEQLAAWAINIITLSAMLVAAVVLGVYILAGLRWRNQPFIGAMFLSPSLEVSGAQPFSSQNWAALESGINAGDVLIAMEGQDFLPETRNELFQERLRQFKIGDRIQLTFLHDGNINSTAMTCGGARLGETACVVDVDLRRVPIADFLVYFGVGAVASMVMYILGLVVLLRRFETRAAKLFATSAAALSVVTVGQFDLSTTFSYVPAWVIASYLFAGLLVSLALTFPHDLAFVRRAPMLRYLPLVVVGGMVLLTLGLYSENRYALFFDAAAFSQVVAVTGLVGVMGWRRQYSSSPIIREQVTFVGLGALFAFTPLFIRTLYLIFFGGELWQQLPPVAQAALLLYTFSVAYAILQYRLLETDRIIPEFAIYLVLTTMLLAGYSLLTLSLGWLTVDTISADSPILVALTIGIIVLFFNPVRNYLGELIDRVMFRQRRNYRQRIDAFTQKLADAVNMGDIFQSIKTELHETVMPAQVLMFVQDSRSQDYLALPKPGELRAETDIVFSGRGGLVKYLSEEQSVLYLEAGQPLPMTVASERSRLAVLNTPLLMGLRGQNRLHAMLAIGSRRSGEAFSYEDLRFIETLADQAALAVERARFVDDLEHRVLVQSVLSQVSRALNFAIDFDTLLELVYAQTIRVIPADHFYIVLYDPSAQELHYSFYNRGDERLSSLEGRRWRFGNDIISDIISQQRPLRVEHYANTQAERDQAPHTHSLHAWMGVPLITDIAERGVGVLGVMCAGSSDPQVTYSDDHLDTLRDIASIAASAIDKTRLFQKTELRAAQLKALNDIASQLASELEDVNRLLETITEKAVDILGCEAGSLLLVEEATQDLVFRVVTGGAGKDLVGKHLPKDKPSLVADAVRLMESIIVNDAIHDKRWFGEVKEGEEKRKLTTQELNEFVSRALLTVPLVAQGQAVGALQVINKRDGSHFTEEDDFLLTSFARQAAIAIQNARLFETQDKQLLLRVQELEGMAQIDNSLNQTLILDRLVEVIMNWALSQTGAKYGAMFLVTEDRQHLRLLASFGYPESGMLFSQGENRQFPLDTGILGRVISTRTPSMVSDPAGDPHYVESLPGCKTQIALPLVSGAEVNAVMFIESDEAGVLDLADMEFLKRFVERASAAIANALLYSELEEQQNKRTEFVSFIAHELKTPITSIKGYANLLVRGVVGELSERQLQFLNTIQSNSEQLEHLVNDIRDMEIIDALGQLPLQMAPISFNQVLHESLQTVQEAFDNKNQTVHLSVPDDLPTIWADQRRLNQIMINFLTNANKYTDENGEVEVMAEEVGNKWDTKGALRVLHIAVRDTGLGISQQDLQHLFEKYFRSTNDKALQQKGTGLGLTLTKRLIEQHGGKIWVESTLNEGTTFHFTIPLASEVLPERATRPIEFSSGD